MAKTHRPQRTRVTSGVAAMRKPAPRTRLRAARRKPSAAAVTKKALQRFEKTCSFVRLAPVEVERILLSQSADGWHEAFAGASLGGESAAWSAALGFSAWKLAQGELAVAERIATGGAESIPLRGRRCRESRWMLWGIALEARIRQLGEGAPDERQSRAREVFDLAVSLFETQRPPRHSAALYAHVYGPLRTVAEILGQAVPGSIRDLERRGRAADTRAASGPRQSTFALMRDGLIGVWRRDGPTWWQRRYEEKFGEPAPENLIWFHEGPVAGFQTNPDMWRLFDKTDHRAYLRAMEATYRAEAGLPQRGEGWVTQTALAKIVAELLPGFEVQREARLPWLDGQRLDIFVPALALAIEYNGLQHYFPVDLFGGEEGLSDRQEMDQRKRDRCAAHGVRLIEWRYSDPVSSETVRARLLAEGVSCGRGGEEERRR